MAHTLEELKRLRRGSDNASSSDSYENKSTNTSQNASGGHTIEELRSLSGRKTQTVNHDTYMADQAKKTQYARPTETKIEKPSYSTEPLPGMVGTNNYLNMAQATNAWKAVNNALSTPKNLPTFESDDALKKYYESLDDYNAIERLFDKDKKEAYNQKQALSSDYDRIKKQEDIETLKAYGITEDDLRKAQAQMQGAPGGIFNKEYMESRASKDEMEELWAKFDKVKEETGIDPYRLQFDYQTEFDKQRANDNPVLSSAGTVVTNPAESALNVGKDTYDYIMGNPIRHNYSYTENVRDTVQEGIKTDAGRFAYGTTMSIADMGMAMLMGGGSLAGAGIQGLEKASSVMNESVDRGLNPNQIMLEGIASGVTTAATEAIPMGKWEEVAKKGFVGLQGKALAKEIAKKFVANAIPEGIQEMSEDVADALADFIIAGDKSEINTNIRLLMENNPGMTKEEAEAIAWKEWTVQMALDGLGGFISGGVMSGLSISAGLMNPYATGEINREALSGEIKKMSPDSEAYQNYQALAEKRGSNLENATANEVSDLWVKAYENLAKEDNPDYEAIIREKLMNKKYTEEEANRTIEALKTENPTESQKELVENELVRDALKETENEDIERMMKKAESVNDLKKTVKSRNEIKSEKRIAEAESKINTATESSHNGEKVKILGMDLKNGEAVIRTDKGDFNADDVKVASSIKDAVAYTVNIPDPTFKEAFIDNYKGQEIGLYEAYAYQAFTAGKNYNGEIIRDKNLINFLGTRETADLIEAGRMSVGRSVRDNETQINETIKAYDGKFRQGTFDDSAVNYKNLDAAKKKMFNFIKGMSMVGGLNVKIINDPNTDMNGNFDYDPENGGLITINLAAAPSFSSSQFKTSYVIPTLSHELTHYLKKNASGAYDALFNAVIKALRTEGMFIDEEVHNKIEEYKKHNITLDEEGAIDEIIAQACEGMMSNAKTMEKTLSYMTQKEMSTFKAALDKFFKMVKDFVTALAGGDEIQNKYAEAVNKHIKDVQDAWARAFATALERQQTLNASIGLKEDMTGDNGNTVVGDDGTQLSIKTYDKNGREFLKEWLKTQDLSAKDQKDILKSLDNIRDTLDDIRKDFPLFDDWSKMDSREEAIKNFKGLTQDEIDRMEDEFKSALTTIVNNSEYPYNFDMATVCKKRQTLDKVLNMLVSDGYFDKFLPDEETITKLVDAIKENGFEVACALCFVDSKRYRVGAWANSIANGADTKISKKKGGGIYHSYGWNELVNSMQVKGKVSVNDFNFLDREIDNERPYKLASDMTVDELREAGALKLIDKIIASDEGNTRNRKFAKAILNNPSIAHTVNPAELMSSQGLDKARIIAPDFHQQVNGAAGQATPKLSHGYTSYENDLLYKLMKDPVSAEDLFKIGGFRMQSFSDYVANNVFDYVQLIGELSANKFPVHAYTKELFFAKIFGMTGIKINLSIVPKAFDKETQKRFDELLKDKGQKKRANFKKQDEEYLYYKEHAGLGKGANEDGSYDWMDTDGTKWHYIIEDESFAAERTRKDGKITYNPYEGFKKALEIQGDSRYNKNCGIIFVGISDNHIRALLRDPRIPMVIPYHRSSINHLVAEMRNIDAYNDYTDWQTEKWANGDSISKADLKEALKDWNFYDDLAKTQDPVQTSKNYVKYCMEHGLRATFQNFAFQEGHEGDFDYFEEGYYKVLTDFRLYAGNADGTMNTEYAPQLPVSLTFPENFKDLVRQSLGEQEEDSKYLDENQEKLYKQAMKIVKEASKGKKQYSLKENSEGKELTEGQKKYFKNSLVVDEQGRLKIMYHGTPKGGFTVFDPNFSDDNLSFFFSDNEKVAKTYNKSRHPHTFNPYVESQKIETAEDAKEYLEKVGYTDIRSTQNKAYGKTYTNWSFNNPSDFGRRVYGLTQKEFIEYAKSIRDTKELLYPVYINLENPYVVDASYNRWNEIHGIEIGEEGFPGGKYDGYIAVDLRIDPKVSEDGETEYFVKSNVLDYYETLSISEIKHELGAYIADLLEKKGTSIRYRNILVNPNTLEYIPNDTRSAADYAYFNGYDGVIIKNVYDNGSAAEEMYSNLAIAFDSNQIKSIYNENPTKDPDIRYSLKTNKDSEGKELSQGQQTYFENSVIRDENGNLKIVYHGTDSEFFAFNTNDFGGKNGRAEGYGIYFTDDKEITEKYGNRQLKGYLNITKPAYSNKKTITSVQLSKFIRDLCEKQAEEMVANGEYEKKSDAIKDSWISNYEYTYDKPIETVYRSVANNILKTNTNDMNIVQEVMFGYGIYSYKQANEFYSILKKSLGFDGFVTYWTWSDGQGESEIDIAFDSNQFKLVDNLNPTENDDIRYSLKSDRDSEGNVLSPGQQSFFKNTWAVDKNGNLLVMYHGTKGNGFSVFEPNKYVKESNGLTRIKGYFGTNREYSEAYGDVSPYYLNVTNPLDFREYETDELNDGSLDSYRRWLESKGVKNIKFDSGIEQSTIIGGTFTDKNGNKYTAYVPYELFDAFEYWNGDGNLTEQIAKAGYDSVIWSEGYNDDDIAIMPFEANAIKKTDNLNPTDKNEIQYSLKSDEPSMSVPGEEEVVNKLKQDMSLLRKFINANKDLAKKEWTSKDTDIVAEYLIKTTKSSISRKELRESLANLYNQFKDILKNDQKNDFSYIMNKCYSLAAQIYENQAEKVKVDSNVDKAALNAVRTIKEKKTIQDLAVDIYNRFWTAVGLTANTDPNIDEIKKIRAMHRKNVENIAEKQNKSDVEYYKDIIYKVVANAKIREAELKEKNDERVKNLKIANDRKAEIEKITDTAKTLSKWLLQNSTKHPIPKPFREPLMKLLSTIDFSSKQLLTKGKATKKDESISFLLNKVRDELAKIEQGKVDSTEDKAATLGMIDLPPYMLEEMGKVATNLQELELANDTRGASVLQLMSLEDLQKLREELKVLNNSISKANRLISRSNAESVNYIAQDIIQYLKKLGNKKVDNRVTQFLDLDNKTPYYFFKGLGEGGKLMFDILADGWDKLAFLSKDIKEFTEKTYKPSDVHKWENNIREFTVMQKPNQEERLQGKKAVETKIKLTDAQIMSLYCLSKREQALKHILRNGIAIGKIENKGKKVPVQDTCTLTKKDLDRIISVVENDPEMKRVADALQKFMSTVCAEWGNEVTWKRFGIRSFDEENYFPIKVNQETLKKEQLDRFNSLYGLLNQSFTKPLSDEVNNEIMVYDIFDVFTQHTSDMAKYNALGLPLLDVLKIWNYSESDTREGEGEKKAKQEAKEKGETYYVQKDVQTVKKSILKALGEKGNSYINTLLQDINGYGETGRYDSLGKLMSKPYKTARVAANIQTALLQPLSYIRAAYVMDPKYLAQAMLHKPQMKKIKEEIGVSLWKDLSLGVDTNIGKGLDRIIKNDDTWKDKVIEKSLALAQLGDDITWGYLYNAVEAEFKDLHRDLKPGTEEYKKAFNERIRNVMYATQVFDSTLTRSAFMRDRGFFASTTSAFMSEPTVSYNMLLDAANDFITDAKINKVGHALETKKGILARAASVYLVSSVVESTLRAMIKKIRDYDDEDDEFFDGLLEDIIDRTLDELNVLNKIPIAKQLMDALSSFGSYYSNSNRTDDAFIESIKKAYQAIMKAYKNEEISYSTIYTALQALSDVTGIPVANAVKEVKTILNNTYGRATGNYIK